MKRTARIVFATVLLAVAVRAQTGDHALPPPAFEGEVTAHSDILPAQALADLPDDSLAAAPVQSVVFEQDSATRAAAHARLLPKNISFAEQLMWGDNGAFRKFGLVPALTPEERKTELSLRRTMLTAHQIGGFVSLALMMTTAYFGQQVLNGRRDLLHDHQAFIAATIAAYSATAALSILSPPPLIRRDELSTTTIHKTLAWVHVAGMIITPILGSMIKRRSPNYDQQARFHQIAGYVTTATFAASMIVVTF